MSLSDWWASLTWTCHVCGEERPDAAIHTARRPVAGHEDLFPALLYNVRYCTDRPDCTAVANEPGPWPRRDATPADPAT